MLLQQENVEKETLKECFMQPQSSLHTSTMGNPALNSMKISIASTYAVSRYGKSPLDKDEEDYDCEHDYSRHFRTIKNRRGVGSVVTHHSHDSDDDNEDGSDDECEDLERKNIYNSSSVKIERKSSVSQCLINNASALSLSSMDDVNITENAVSSDFNTQSVVKSKMEDERESTWKEALNDAIELENLIFSVRRPTARSRLVKLASGLRQLSAKLKRHEEVKTGLLKQKQNNTNKESTREKRGVCDIVDSDTECNKKSRNNDMTEEQETPLFVIDRSPLDVNLSKNVQTLASVNIVVSGEDDPRTGKKNVPSRAITTLSSSKSNGSSTSISETEENSIDRLTAAPLLKVKDKWVQYHQRGSPNHCPDFDSTNACPLGSTCTRLHIHRLLPTSRSTSKDPRLCNFRLKTSIITYSREDLERAYKLHRTQILTNADYAEKIKPDLLHRPRYTSSVICPIDRIIYYAQPMDQRVDFCTVDSVTSSLSSCNSNGVNSNSGTASKSAQGIWWYDTMKEARDAVATVVIRDLQSRGNVPSNFAPDPSAAATLSELAGRKKSASAIAASKAASLFRQVQISETSSGNLSSFLDTISIVGDRGISKTPTTTNSKKISTSAISHSVSVKKTLHSALPQINPWNWMEQNYERRCSRFHRPNGGCEYGPSCRYSHVHYPTSVRTDGTVPHRVALKIAYAQNFGLNIADPFWDNAITLTTSSEDTRIVPTQSHFCIKSATDDMAQTWYTAAWQCPRECTIYYAAGGNNGRVNGQNMYLYPTSEDAKSALCGVILDAFRARGSYGAWKVTESLISKSVNCYKTEADNNVVPNINKSSVMAISNDPRLNKKLVSSSDPRLTMEVAATGTVMRKTSASVVTANSPVTKSFNTGSSNLQTFTKQVDKTIKFALGKYKQVIAGGETNNGNNFDATFRAYGGSDITDDDDNLEKELFGGSDDEGCVDVLNHYKGDNKITENPSKVCKIKKIENEKLAMLSVGACVVNPHA